MATHSTILAWEILWTEESGSLQSTVSQRGKHDGATEQQQHMEGLHCLLAVRIPVNIIHLNLHVIYR